MFYAEFCQLMQGAFENYARRAALLHRQKSVSATSVEQTVVDRSRMRQSMLLTYFPSLTNSCMKKGFLDLQQRFVADNGFI